MSTQQVYGYTMAATYDTGLEPAPQDFPEIASPQHQHQHLHQQPQQPTVNNYYGGYQQHQQPPSQQQPYDPSSYDQQHQQHYQDHLVLPKPEPTPPSTYAAVAPSTIGGQTAADTSYNPHGGEGASQRKSSKAAVTICGCSLLVFILACIIALLSAAVIGLAAGTGIESNRANEAVARLAVLSTSAVSTATVTTTSAPAPTSTLAAANDQGCAADPNAVTNTTYTSFELFGALRFTIFCNKDTPMGPLYSLFTASFAGCMDACAAYTHSMPVLFGNNNSTTCAAVSFVPAWTTHADALKGTAPGNCYLKPAPLQNMTATTQANMQAAVHAAVLIDG
ncbi:hypothetical protein B0T17DRAFT_520266 [Bombardia bombarda]|uniref:Uncharacterized protein n=1 Tax=Bombardia bombarda TaxID=252184 RepID=A0AA40CGR5_9PEZI|nr:hypothetical protein B0T17DRAFT_520266 [Bombardia bombarda]